MKIGIKNIKKELKLGSSMNNKINKSQKIISNTLPLINSFSNLNENYIENNIKNNIESKIENIKNEEEES